MQLLLVLSIDWVQDLAWPCNNTIEVSIVMEYSRVGVVTTTRESLISKVILLKLIPEVGLVLVQEVELISLYGYQLVHP